FRGHGLADHRRGRDEAVRALEHAAAAAVSTTAAVSAGRAGRYAFMRPRASLTGPLVLIAVGVIFLIHAISPEFAVADRFLRHWPYLLILWGLIAFIEVNIGFMRGGQAPTNGVSGAGWVLVLFICLIGV